MVACYRNSTTCKWHHYKPPIKNTQIEYDFWLVNGNPNHSSFNPLVYQFSFDQQNTLELYFVFWCVYVILVPLQLYAVRTQKHPVTKLFTASLLLEFIAICFALIHALSFALDGIGHIELDRTGDILDIVSRVSLYQNLIFIVNLVNK